MSVLQPAALLDEDGGDITEINQAAEALGVQIGSTSSLAIARAPNLLLLPRSASMEKQFQITLLQLAYRYSPFLEDSAPGICTLDLKGKRTRHHESWLRELLAQLQRIGLKAQAGIAPNPEIALQAAKIGDPILLINHQDKLLLSLSLLSLSPSPYLLDILHSWGIRTLGALTKIPRDEIGQRLGLEGLSLWDRAAGRSSELLRYVHPPETFEESIDFEAPLETLEPLLFILRRFLERLSARVGAAYLLIAELRLTLNLEDGRKIVRALQIPAPTREVEALFRITFQYLETEKTSAPILSLHLEALPTQPGHHQFDLFQGGLKDPNRFFQTLARLAALVGTERVGIAEKANTHQPDQIRMRWPEFNWSAEPFTKEKTIGPALRRCRPSIMAKVQLQEGKPIKLESSLVSGKICQTRGPWKSSGNWWDQSRWALEEWDIQLDDGNLYRLAQNLGQWEVVGIYD